MYIYDIQNLDSWFETTEITDLPTYHILQLLVSATPFNNCNIIALSHRTTTSEAFEDINQVVLDGISYKMASLVQSGKYGAMNTTDASTMG